MSVETAQALAVFVSAFAVAAFSGLAALLRFGKLVNPYTIFGAMLNSGLLGLAIALFWYNKFLKDGNIYTLIGICILSGLGGSTITDLVVFIFKKGGIFITITRSDTGFGMGDGEDDEPPPPKRKKR